jgi:hypothetical protein
MSALQEVNLLDFTIKQREQDKFRKVVADVFWSWFESNHDTKVTTVQFWIVKKSIFVRDLRSIFELLFGPQPNGSST